MEYVYENFPAGPLQCNCTLIAHPPSQTALVVDPGGDVERIIAFLTKHKIIKVFAVHTHAHFDHILASGILKERTGAVLALHPDDKPLWEHLEDQCRMFGVPCSPLPPPDHLLAHQEEITLGSGKVLVLHTPGHTPGSSCFLFPEVNLLVAGDTLFRGGIGRTDLWGGDYKKIYHSIREILFKLDDNLAVITGHGPPTTIYEEKVGNPYVKF